MVLIWELVSGLLIIYGVRLGTLFGRYFGGILDNKMAMVGEMKLLDLGEEGEAWKW